MNRMILALMAVNPLCACVDCEDTIKNSYPYQYRDLQIYDLVYDVRMIIKQLVDEDDEKERHRLVYLIDQDMNNIKTLLKVDR